MDQLLTAQTRENILTFCEKRGIKQALKWSEDPLDNDDRSRVKAFDVDGLLMRHIQQNYQDWSKDGGAMHNVHGIQVRGSYRSRTTPSLQVCVIEAKGGQYSEVLEIDIDYYSPFENALGHTAEVLQNKLLRKTTDPLKIAKMLQKLENKTNA